MNFIFGTADVIIKTTLFVILGVILFVLFCGVLWKWNLYTQNMYEDFSVVEYAPKTNTEEVGSLVTDIIKRNSKCKNTVEPTKTYSPTVANGLIVDETVYVYDEIHTKQWHKATVKEINQTTQTISVLYAESSVYELAETNIPFSRIRRLPSSTEIESCAKACGLKRSISVGDCVVGNPCKCMCTYDEGGSGYDECQEQANTIWNTYMVDPYTVDIKKRAIQFGILKKNKSSSNDDDDTSDSNACACSETNKDCVSYCDKLPTANQRALCKNPTRLLEYSSSLPTVATLKTDAMCNYQLPTPLRTAMKCPDTTAKKACWQYDTQTECDTHQDDDCKWNLDANTCQTNRTTQQKCIPFTTSRVFHKTSSKDYFEPIFKDCTLPTDTNIIEPGFYPTDISDQI